MRISADIDGSGGGYPASIKFLGGFSPFFSF